MPGRYNRKVTIVIENIVAWSAIISGLYLASPLVDIVSFTAGSPLLAFLGSDILLIVYGIAYLLSGVLILRGNHKDNRKFLRNGLGVLFLLKLYVLFSVFLVTGLLPLTWLNSAVTLVITGYLWTLERRP